MYHRCCFLRNSGGQVSGGPVRNITGSMKSLIQPSICNATIEADALVRRRCSAVAVEMEKEASVEPPMKRKWLRSPPSALSTSSTRRDWFRVMNFNMMTDSWTEKTTPVMSVDVRQPVTSISAGQSQTEGLQFMTRESRRKSLTELLNCYDPDVVCLNEVNRTFFNTDMWRYVRYLGYGNLFQSSRGSRAGLRRMGNGAGASRVGSVKPSEDIGNVILFHKGRFFPLLMPGRDIGGHYHFGHIVALRDKVTNLTLCVASIQLTQGASTAAKQVRLYEAKQVLMLLDSLSANNSDRDHMTTIVAGDLNNVTDDEPCVEVLRDQYFSAYDLAGGPRWTTWHHQGAKSSYDDTYFVANYNQAKECAKSNLLRLSGDTSQDTARLALSLPEVGPSSQLLTSPVAESESAVVRRTQDFMFFDPNKLALHQILDIPDDSEVDANQLLPNAKNPSHHIPLLADVSFNDPFPKL